jgi:hypothetical protein
MPPRRLVPINDQGMRIGEGNPNAAYTDRDVELVFELRELGWSYRVIALKLDASKSWVRKVLKGHVRAQLPARFKRVG